MTISAYQVDNVIKAYNKQNRMRAKSLTPQGSRQEDSLRGDVVTLSAGKGSPDEVYKVISYNLLDVILKTKGR